MKTNIKDFNTLCEYIDKHPERLGKSIKVSVCMFKGTTTETEFVTTSNGFPMIELEIEDIKALQKKYASREKAELEGNISELRTEYNSKKRLGL